MRCVLRSLRSSRLTLRPGVPPGPDPAFATNAKRLSIDVMISCGPRLTGNVATVAPVSDDTITTLESPLRDTRMIPSRDHCGAAAPDAMRSATLTARVLAIATARNLTPGRIRLPRGLRAPSGTKRAAGYWVQRLQGSVAGHPCLRKPSYTGCRDSDRVSNGLPASREEGRSRRPRRSRRNKIDVAQTSVRLFGA